MLARLMFGFEQVCNVEDNFVLPAKVLAGKFVRDLVFCYDLKLY